MSNAANANLHLAFIASVVGFVGTIFVNGCSSNEASVACDSSKCAAGNSCIEEKGEAKCRRLCASQLECPFNYTCVPNAAGDAGQKSSFCALNAASLTERAGTWGTPCNPTKEPAPNADCDRTQSFYCFAQNPTDATAYCTRKDCMADAECAGGYTCATVNSSPDATNPARSIEETIRVCKKREYCDTCTTDLDCPQWGARKSHCVPDDSGNTMCSVECDTSEACNNEAVCAPANGTTVSVCLPRAGKCVGDGSLCAPCKSDADCPAGLCANTQYSTERFCTKKSSTPCNGGNGDCPTTLPSGIKVGCSQDVSPWWVDQCTGLVSFAGGQQTIAGCYTPAR